jgi:hypothetical protein
LWNTDLFSRIDDVIEARDDGRTVAVLTIE